MHRKYLPSKSLTNSWNIPPDIRRLAESFLYFMMEILRAGRRRPLRKGPVVRTSISRSRALHHDNTISPCYKVSKYITQYCTFRVGCRIKSDRTCPWQPIRRPHLFIMKRIKKYVTHTVILYARKIIIYK